MTSRIDAPSIDDPQTPKTVLVLGAGVSKASGFPDGKRLVREIIARTSQMNRDTIAAQLHTDLINSNPYSIDAFLADRKEYRDVAAELVLRIMLEHEDHAQLMQNAFLRFLFETIPVNKYADFKIITFNYDRSIEHYFTTSIAARFKKGLTVARELQKRLEVFHVYGQVPIGFGPLKGCSSEYGQISDCAKLDNDCQSFLNTMGRLHIQFISDEAANREGLWGNYLKNAHQIFILGFSFDDLNMNALFGKHRPSPQGEQFIGATCYGMGRVEVRSVRNKYNFIRDFCDTKADRFFSNYYHLTDRSMNHLILHQKQEELKRFGSSIGELEDIKYTTRDILMELEKRPVRR